MKQIKISYIIPAYNCEMYIENCVNALVKQNIESFEILIIDDGSTDSTAAICDKLAMIHSEVRIISKINEGQGIARNIGIDEAKGKYIAFIDADDQPQIFSYGKVLELIDRGSYDWVICRWDTFFDGSSVSDNSYEEKLEVKPLKPDDTILDIAAGKNKLSSAVWNKIYNSDIIKKYNVRFKSEREVISEDFLFNCDYSQHVINPIRINILLYNYRINNDSFCHKYQHDYFNRLLQLKKELDDRYADSKLISGLYLKLYSFIKSCIIQEVQFKSFADGYKEIKNICSCRETKKIISLIDKSLLDNKNQMIYELIKHRAVLLLMGIYKINI